MPRFKFFQLTEFLPPSVFNEFKHRGSSLWLMFDDRLLRTADALRNRYGRMTYNNWGVGGPRTMSGFRPFDSETGVPLSQHKFGRAGDALPADVSPEDIRRDILATPWDEDFHFDVRNHDKEEKGILLIRP